MTHRPTRQKRTRDLPSAELHQLFIYNPISGEILHRRRVPSMFTGSGWCNAAGVCKRWNTRYGGKSAVYIHPKTKYAFVRFKGAGYLAHRVAWSMYYGSLPKDLCIDHINRDRNDNRIINLRLVTHQQNMRNLPKCAENKSGHVGVYFDRRRGKWSAYIGGRATRKNLGQHTTIESAIAARRAAEIEHGFHLNHWSTTKAVGDHHD